MSVGITGRHFPFPLATATVVGSRELRFEAVLDFYGDLESFYYIYTRKVFENGEGVYEKTWDETIPRVFQ